MKIQVVTFQNSMQMESLAAYETFLNVASQ